jgi:autotransporter-associated beta strand protein
MSSSPRTIWRLLRYFLLIVSAGAVLAADNTWMTKLRFDFKDSLAWLSNFYPAEEKAELPVLTEAMAAPNVDAALGMDRLMNGLLYSRPGTGWTLDSSKTSALSIKAEETSQPTVFTTNWLPTATLSAGFIASSGWLTAPIPSAPTATGNWISNASGDWGTASNWQTNVIANGAGSAAHFDLLNITTDVTVNLEAPRTIGNVYLGDTNGTNHYTISGNPLTFDSGTAFVSAILQQSSTSAGDTFAAPILLLSDLDVNNLSATNPLHISGNIASSGAANSFQMIWFNNTAGATGNVRVSGNISDGTTGGALSLVVVRGGTVTLEGANTYTGFTEVDGGTLLINGTNSGPGSVYVYDTGTLGGTGTVAGNLYTFGGTVTGATATTVGTLTLQGNANFATGEGAGGTYLANLSNSLSDLLAITGQLILGAGTTLDIQGAADGTTTYVLATFASHNDVFDMVMGVPSGYALVYNPTDLELVPIPEPATWLGAILAAGPVGFVSRRKLRRA